MMYMNDEPKIKKQCKRCEKPFETVNETRLYCAKCTYPSRKKYRAAHLEKAKATTAAWRVRRRKVIREKFRRWRVQIKIKAFGLFGSKCQCCGFDDERALQINHRNGARGMRTTSLRCGVRLYSALVHGQEDLAKFQLLCANCNWIKRFEKLEHCIRKS